jgi:hypothetical protein
MSEAQRRALEAAKVLLANGDHQAWAARVLLEDFGGEAVKQAVLRLAHARLAEARAEIARLLAEAAQGDAA